jgi:hypothetical protein
MTQAETIPAGKELRSDAASPKKAQGHWRGKDASGFSAAGRELSDDELDDIVGGLEALR